MVTIRTYWSLAEAALAKSLLDNYEIPAALLDENASLYNRGAQFAVPVRLVVDETEVERAAHILNAEFEKADEIELRADATSMSSGEPENANRNPWELLVVAFYILLPAACVLQTKYPVFVKFTWRIRREIAAVTVFHFIGWLEAILATVLVVTYVRIWRSS
jgi:hypothetical protein